MKYPLTVMFLLFALQAAAAESAGFRSVTVPAAHHGREMTGVVWYPSAGGGESVSFGENAVFHGTRALDGARMAEGRFPVILASHGLGGHIGALGWLTAGLAEAEALVISVNHPNSTLRGRAAIALAMRRHGAARSRPHSLFGLGTAETRLPATDFTGTGSGFAALLPHAEVEIMAPAAHFSGLPPCKPRGPAILAAEGDVPVCDDPPDTDRASLHKRIVTRIAAFLGL